MYFPQRVAAAFFAISFRFLADIPAARAFPPFRPSATAAGSLPSDSGGGTVSSISPAAILAIMTARAFTSTGRRSPFGPLGTGTPFPGFGTHLVEPITGAFIVQKLPRSPVSATPKLPLDVKPATVIAGTSKLVGQLPHAFFFLTGGWHLHSLMLSGKLCKELAI